MKIEVLTTGPRVGLEWRDECWGLGLSTSAARIIARRLTDAADKADGARNNFTATLVDSETGVESDPPVWKGRPFPFPE